MLKNSIKKINNNTCNISYYSKSLLKDENIIPCKYCIFYMKPNLYTNISKGKCGKYLDIKKDPLCETIAKKKYCDNNPKYFIY
jgi:hypothetical protein